MSTLIAIPPIASRDHVVLFYGSDEELAERVGSHLAEAVHVGGTVIAIASAGHCRGFEGWMSACGVDVRAVTAEGRYRPLDADETLQRFLVDGRPDPERFDEVIGHLVRGAAATGRPVYAYGEMVALLWGDGRVNAAIELESLWNDLRDRVPFSLFCAYPSASLTDEDQGELVNQVCCLHTAVLGAPPHCRSTRSFTATAAAPRASRRFVIETIERFGLPPTAGDAALIATELATNAVLHARTDFTVAVALSGTVLRIEVRDGSLAPPTPPTEARDSGGRGLMLVKTLASAWGSESLEGGKIVWAELPADDL